MTRGKFYPVGVDALDEGSRPLGSLDRRLEHAIHVDVVAVDGARRAVGCVPTNEDGFVELPLESELLRRRH